MTADQRPETADPLFDVPPDEGVAARYARRAALFTRTVAAVPPERWDRRAPCEDWSARDVVAHVVETQGMFEQLVGRSLEPGPAVAQDAAGAARHAFAQVLGHLRDPACADAEFDGFEGRTTFAAAVDRFLCLDLVVHRWDLARATGGDERIPPADVQHTREAAQGLGDALRGPNAFGPPVEPPPGADEQTRLLCFLGRRP